MTITITPTKDGVPHGRGRPANPVVQNAVSALIDYYNGGGAFPIRLEGMDRNDGIKLRRSALWKNYTHIFKLTVSWKGVYVSLVEVEG